MKTNISIQLKASFLLLVFAFNTAIGFACAVGMDMDFNTHHHDEEANGFAVPVNADGKKHQHHKETGKHNHNEKDSSKKDDCCNDKVLKLSQTEKTVPLSIKILSPVFVTAFVAVYFNINISYPPQDNTANKFFVYGHHPPIPDIRIAIQSFQI